MRTPPRAVIPPILPMLALAILVGGCASNQMPRIDPTGERLFVSPSSQGSAFEGQPVSAAPPSPCGAADAVAATSAPVAAATSPPIGTPAGPVAGVTVDREKPEFTLVVSPGKTIAPVGSEVIVLGGVLSRNNYLRKSTRIEWTLTPDSVGHFVDLRKADWCDYLVLDFTNPRKINNRYAIGSTSRESLTLTKGTPTKKDDVKVLRGQAWISVTSQTEGVSRVALYSDKVKQWDGHMKTAVIHWIDAGFGFPAPKIGPAGTRQLLTTTVRRHSDLVPCVGWSVRYRITAGPSAGFSPNGAAEIEVPVNESGQATVELFQPTPTAGVNTISVEVFRPAMDGAEKFRVGTGSATVEWTAPRMHVQKSGLGQAGLGDDLRYHIVVTNPGPLTPSNVVLTDEIPVGCEFITANPPAQRAGNEISWQVGPVAPNQSLAFDVTLRPKRAGTFTSCATVAADGGVVSRSCVSTEVGAPLITVQIAGPTSAQVGQPVQYAITVMNRGKATASGLTIRDRFDDGLDHEKQSPIERELDSLAPGQSVVVIVDFNVIKPGLLRQQVDVTGPTGVYASQATTLTATAPAAIEPPPSPGIGEPGRLTPPGASPGMPLPGTNPPTDRIPPGGLPASQPAEVDLVVRSATQVVGNEFNIIVRVRVQDADALRNSTMILKVNDSLGLDEATGGFRYTDDPNELAWDILRVVPDQRTIEYEAKCKCTAPGSALPIIASLRLASGATIENRKTITIRPTSGRTAPPSPPLEERPTGGEPPGLEIAIFDLVDPARVGEPCRYNIEVRNTGRTAARNVQVTVRLPEPLGLIQANTQPAFNAVGQDVIFNPIESIPPGESKNFQVRAWATEVSQASTIKVEVKADGLSIPFTKTEPTTILPGESRGTPGGER